MDPRNQRSSSDNTPRPNRWNSKETPRKPSFFYKDTPTNSPTRSPGISPLLSPTSSSSSSPKGSPKIQPKRKNSFIPPLVLGPSFSPSQTPNDSPVLKPKINSFFPPLALSPNSPKPLEAKKPPAPTRIQSAPTSSESRLPAIAKQSLPNEADKNIKQMKKDIAKYLNGALYSKKSSLSSLNEILSLHQKMLVLDKDEQAKLQKDKDTVKSRVLNLEIFKQRTFIKNTEERIKKMKMGISQLKEDIRAIDSRACSPV